MSKKIKWLFETNNSGRWKGFNDSDIERFKKGRYLSLTREVIQNSNDAILDKTLPVRIDFDLLKVNVADIPDIDGLRDKFNKCLPHAKADNNPEAGKWFEKANSILKGKTLQVLRMSDFNTTGMTGPCELGTPYFAYMKAMGTSQKPDENAGGSHGIGKRAPLACSQLRTLFVITKYMNASGATDTLAQGFSALMSHAKTSGSKTGPFVDGEGHWGIADGAMPVDDDNILPKWLSRNEVGTSIYLMAFDAVTKWKQRLIAITLSNYFAAIYRGKLIVKIDGDEINKDTISTLFEGYETLASSLEDEDEKSRVDLKSDLFSYTVDEAALKQAELMDGKLMLVTNVADLTPPEVVQRYKALADIERSFRVLKSEIEIAPVYHRLPERIRAHALVCFLALIVYRVMRQRLKLAKSDLSPERALAELRKIQRHRVRINKAEPISGISTINDSQAEVLETLKIRKPTQDVQLTLL